MPSRVRGTASKGEHESQPERDQPPADPSYFERGVDVGFRENDDGEYTLVSPVIIPFKAMVKLTNFNYVNFNDVGKLRFTEPDISSDPVTRSTKPNAKKRSRFRVWIARGPDQIEKCIQDQKLTSTTDETFESVIIEFYKSIFNEESLELDNLKKKKELWHILIVGLKEKDRRITNDSIRWTVLSAISFVPLEDKETIFLSWLGTTGAESADLDLWDKKPYDDNAFFDGKSFRKGKGFGSFLISCMQYVCRKKGGNALCYNTIHLQSSRSAACFYRSAVGMHEMSPFMIQETDTEFDFRDMPEDISVHEINTENLIRMRFTGDINSLRPPHIHQEVFGIKYLLKTACFENFCNNKFEFDAKMLPEGLKNQPVFSGLFPLLTQDKFLKGSLIQKNSLDLEDSHNVETIRNKYKPNQVAQGKYLDTLLNQFLNIDQSDRNGTTIAFSKEVIGLVLVRLLIAEYISQLSDNDRKFFVSKEPSASAYNHSHLWISSESLTFEAERLFLIKILWCMSKMDHGVDPHNYDRLNWYKAQVTGGVKRYIGTKTHKKDDTYELSDWEKSYMKSALFVDSVMEAASSRKKVTAKTYREALAKVLQELAGDEKEFDTSQDVIFLLLSMVFEVSFVFIKFWKTGAEREFSYIYKELNASDNPIRQILIHTNARILPSEHDVQVVEKTEVQLKDSGDKEKPMKVVDENPTFSIFSNEALSENLKVARAHNKKFRQFKRLNKFYETLDQEKEEKEERELKMAKEASLAEAEGKKKNDGIESTKSAMEAKKDVVEPPSLGKEASEPSSLPKGASLAGEPLSQPTEASLCVEPPSLAKEASVPSSLPKGPKDDSVLREDADENLKEGHLEGVTDETEASDLNEERKENDKEMDVSLDVEENPKGHLEGVTDGLEASFEEMELSTAETRVDDLGDAKADDPKDNIPLETPEVKKRVETEVKQSDKNVSFGKDTIHVFEPTTILTADMLQQLDKPPAIDLPSRSQGNPIVGGSSSTKTLTTASLPPEVRKEIKSRKRLHPIQGQNQPRGKNPKLVFAQQNDDRNNNASSSKKKLPQKNPPQTGQKQPKGKTPPVKRKQLLAMPQTKGKKQPPKKGRGKITGTDNTSVVPDMTLILQEARRLLKLGIPREFRVSFNDKNDVRQEYYYDNHTTNKKLKTPEERKEQYNEFAHEMFIGIDHKPVALKNVPKALEIDLKRSFNDMSVQEKNKLIPEYTKLAREVYSNHSDTLEDYKKHLNDLMTAFQSATTDAARITYAEEIQSAVKDLETLHFSLETELFLSHHDNIVALKYLNKPHLGRYRYFAITDKVIFNDNGVSDFRVTIPLTKIWVEQCFDADFVEAVKAEGQSDGFIHFQDPTQNHTEESIQLYEENKDCLYEDQNVQPLAKKRYFLKGQEGDLQVILKLRCDCTFEGESLNPKTTSWKIQSVSSEVYHAKSYNKTRQKMQWFDIDTGLVMHDSCIGSKLAIPLEDEVKRLRQVFLSDPNRRQIPLSETHTVSSTELSFVGDNPPCDRIPCYILGEKQICSIKYDSTKNFYYGKTIASVYMGRRVCKITTLDKKWVAANFRPNFLISLQENTDKYLWIPVGTARPDCVYPYEYNKDYPRIMFRQEDRETCVTSSFASCLHYMNMSAFAVWVEEFGRNFIEDNSNNQSRFMQQLANSICTNINAQHFRSYWQLKKIVPVDFDVFSIARRSNPMLLQLCCSNGSVGHAITVYEGKIFDSNLEYAVDLTSTNLDFCCASVYEGIIIGYECIPIIHKNKLSSKSRRRHNKKKI